MAPPLLHGSRIVFLLPSFGLGGAERQAFLLARYLRQVEHADVHLVSLSCTTTLTSEFEAAGLTSSHFDLRHAYRSRLGHATDVLRFAAYLRRLRTDILFPYCMFQNILAALTWRLGGVRAYVWNQRDEGRSRLEPWVERLAVGQTRRFVSNSQHGARFLIEELGAPATRVSVVPNGIEVPPAGTIRVRWRERLGIPPSAFMATMVANLHAKKDHATLIAAWGRVTASPFWSTPPHLLLAGALGDQHAALVEQVRSAGLAGCVHFLGELRDVDGLLGAVDLAVFSSFNEGVPNAVLEAMSHGLPVVATDYCGIREAVGPEGAWLLARARDAEDLAARILLAASNPERRRQAGMAARDRVRSEFSIARMAERMVQIAAAELAVSGRRRGAAAWLPLRRHAE